MAYSSGAERGKFRRNVRAGRRLVAGLPGVALLWLAGTMLLHQLPRLPDPAWYPTLLAVAVGAAVWWRTRWLCWLVAGFCLAGVAAGQRLADRLPAELAGRDFRVQGWVDAFPDSTPERQRLSLTVTHADHPDVPRRLRINWYDSDRDLYPGDGLDVVVRLRRPRGTMNPGGFDYERWLFISGYGATGYVRSGDLSDEVPESLGRSWLRTRAALAGRLHTAAGGGDAAALLVALSLGERGGFDDEHWAQLRRTGTSHLVAISGMHVGLIAALVFVVVRRLWLHMPGTLAHHDLEAAGLVSLAAAAVYAALAGFAIPTQRALIMVAVALLITVSRRHTGLFSGLAMALLAVIIFDPLAPLSASFWMSYFAVLLLLMTAMSRLVVDRGRTLLAGWRTRAMQLAGLQWYVSLGLTPLVALYFGEFSVVSPFVNFVAIPFFSLLLVPGTLLAALLISIHGPTGTVAVQAVAWLAEHTWLVLGGVAALPWSAFDLPGASAAAYAVAVVAVLLAVPAHPLAGRRLLWLTLLVLACQPRPDSLRSGELHAVVLDVGHGLAVLVRTASHSLVYDAGARYRSGFDNGSEVVIPAIRALDLPPPARVVISHDHNDHTGGIASVLAAYPRASVLKGPDVGEPEGEICATGMTWVWDDVVFTVLHPSPDFPWRGNESSCVLKISAAGGSMLLTGDMEAHGERAILDDPALQSDVIVVGHHGSRTSSSQPFVDRVRAAHALISVDYYSRWQFPDPDVRRRWQRAGAQVHVTGEVGALSVSITADEVRVLANRLRRPRYWQADSMPLSGESGAGAL